MDSPRIPATPYLALLTRAEASRVEARAYQPGKNGYPGCPCPALPRPGRGPGFVRRSDCGVQMEVYGHSSIGSQPGTTPPPLTEEETAWLREKVLIDRG
ncbi:MAG: hypothetical protein U0401_03590 [Anaerolineae bacterium]